MAARQTWKKCVNERNIDNMKSIISGSKVELGYMNEFDFTDNGTIIDYAIAMREIDGGDSSVVEFLLQNGFKTHTKEYSGDTAALLVKYNSEKINLYDERKYKREKKNKYDDEGPFHHRDGRTYNRFGQDMSMCHMLQSLDAWNKYVG